jgi:hypothetical protein
MDQTRKASRLHKVDKTREMIFVGWLVVKAQQDTGGTGIFDGTSKLYFLDCRRMCRILTIEPATMHRFGHDHRLSDRFVRVDQTVNSGSSNHTLRDTVNRHGPEPTGQVQVVEDRVRRHHIDINPRVQQLPRRLVRRRRLSGERAQ